MYAICVYVSLKATKHMIPLGFHDTYALLYPESAQWDATNERPNSTIPPRTPIKYTHNPSTKCAADGSDLAKPTATTEGYANDVKTRYKKTFFRVKMMIQNFLLIRFVLSMLVKMCGFGVGVMLRMLKVCCKSVFGVCSLVRLWF